MDEMTWIDRFTLGLWKKQRNLQAKYKKRKLCLKCHQYFRPRTRQQRNNCFCSADCCNTCELPSDGYADHWAS